MIDILMYCFMLFVNCLILRYIYNGYDSLNRLEIKITSIQHDLDRQRVKLNQFEDILRFMEIEMKKKRIRQTPKSDTTIPS